MTISQLLERACERHGAGDAAIFAASGERCRGTTCANVRRGRGRPAGARRATAATASASGRPTASNGSWRSSVPRASARSWSTSTQPTGVRAGVRAEQGRCRVLVMARALKSSDYVGMLRGLAPEIDAGARGDGSTAREAAALGTSCARRAPRAAARHAVLAISCGSAARRIATAWRGYRPSSTPTTRSTSSSRAAPRARPRARR